MKPEICHYQTCVLNPCFIFNILIIKSVLTPVFLIFMHSERTVTETECSRTEDGEDEANNRTRDLQIRTARNHRTTTSS